MTVIGIDLGTFNSAMATMLPDGKIVLLQSSQGPTAQGTVIPSFLKFYPSGDFEKYGESAREDMAIAPQWVIWGLKRLIGRDYAQVQRKGELNRFSYAIQEDANGSIVIPIGKKTWTPLDLITLFLKKIKADAESEFNPLQKVVTKAVITRPAFFDTYQIDAVKTAALQAGFEEVELITEPEAAACAYQDQLNFENSPWIMVIDWGAGTLDMVITRFALDTDQFPKITSIFSPYGDTALGGIDMDKALFDEVLRQNEITNIDPVTQGRISSEIEKGKVYLSTNGWVKRFFLHQGKNRTLFMARSQSDIPPGEKTAQWLILEDVLSDILDQFETHLSFALKKEGLRPSDIDQVILVGGPMYMPCVRAVVAKVFEKNTRVIAQLEQIDKEGFPVSPLEAVVYGAVMKQNFPEGLDRVPYGYGYLMDDYLGDILIPEGTVLPEAETSISKESTGINNPMLQPGVSMRVSLLKKVVVPDGEKYYQMGVYEFVPIVLENGTAFKPVIEMDHDGIISLKLIDYQSNTPDAFQLNFSRHQEIEVRRPDVFLSKKAEAESAATGTSSRMNAQADGGKNQGGYATGGTKPLLIPKEKSKALSEKGQAYLKFIDSLFIERDFSANTMQLYEQLKTALLDFEMSSHEQQAFQKVHRTCELLRNQLIVSENFSESEIMALL